jgi:twinkle protein
MTAQQQAMEWLQEVRGISVDLCARMGVTGKTRQDGTPAVAFAYREGGAVYGHKIRATQAKEFLFHPSGVQHRLYNLDALRDDTMLDEPIIITEGEIDCLSVIEAGFPRSVSIPDGWTDGMEGGDGAKVKPITDEEKYLRRSPCVIVAGDNDSTGVSFTRAVANLLPGHVVRYCQWPAGCKDANDVLKKHGPDELARRITESKPLDPKGGFITGFSDLPPVRDSKVFKLGLEFLDNRLAFEIGALSVGTGTPGSGKSTFATFAMNRIVKKHGARMGMMAFETHPFVTRDHLARLNTGKRWEMLVGKERDELLAKLDRNWRLVHRSFEDATTHNLGWLENMVRTLAVRDQCEFILIDPWNELEHLPEPGESMTAYINFALQRIRQMAERFDTHICLIAHPKKMTGEGRDKTPTGYDIADSAAFFNKPSLGFTVHQAEEGGEPCVEIRTWKVRNVQKYDVFKGKTNVIFDPSAMVYREKH